METRTHLQALDHISISHIFSYLNTSDVLIHLNLTCKDFHKVISTSPYIIKSLFENLFGRNIFGRSPLNLDSSKLQEIIKSTFAAPKNRQQIPFFGFRGNCGCYANHSGYSFEKVFEFSEDTNVVSTLPGENFDIEGVLSEDFGRETKYIQDMISTIDKTDLDEFTHLVSFKHYLKRHGFRALGLVNGPLKGPLIEKMQSLIKFRSEQDQYLQTQNSYHIELPCQKMARSIGLIQSCLFRRQVEDMTCPIKTLVAFASLNEEIGPSHLPSLFSKSRTSDDLIQLLKEQKNELPKVHQTSIKRLAESSPDIKYINEEEAGVEFVVFHSNGRKQDVKPLFWSIFRRLSKRISF